MILEKFDIKGDFIIAKEGVSYVLPKYKVTEKGLEETDEVREIDFVRGTKDGDRQKHEGIIHEDLLAMMIHDLKFKNKEIPSRETSIVITKLEEARLWLLKRQIERTVTGKISTDEK